jgi:hypothetical protein
VADDDNSELPVAPAPEPQDGTALWNIQTQAPEWVPLSEISTRLKSGAYREYAGSDVTVRSGIGGEQSLSPGAAGVALAGGAQTTTTSGERASRAAQAQIEGAYDTAGDKALALTDGLVSGLSGDLLEGVPTGDSITAQFERSMRDKVHPGYKQVGELTALAATALAPESALKYTPLGLANQAMSKTAKLVKAAAGTGVLASGLAEGVGGAVASGALSTAHAVQDAVNNRPVSGWAIVDDVGLGALIGGGFGSAGELLGRSASRGAELRKQVEAAARFDETAKPVLQSLNDVSTAWSNAHAEASARFDKLQDLVDSGLLDANMPGEEWLSERKGFKTEADKAAKKLARIAGTDDPQGIAGRIQELAASGKAKEAERLYKAFDDYGTAVSKLDDAMRPTVHDRSHLGDVLDLFSNLDEEIPASEHPLQKLESMIQNGAPEEEVKRFVDEYDRAYAKQGKPPEEGIAQEKSDAESTQAKTGEQGPNARRRPVETPTKDIGLRRPTAKLESGMGEVPSLEHAPPADLETPAPEIRDMSRDRAGMEAMQTLGQHEQFRAVRPMVRPTDLGLQIQTALDRLTAATNGKLGSAPARSLAQELGMNLRSLSGPVSSRLADLWALHRMSESLGQVAAGGGKKAGLLGKAVRSGVISSAGLAGYKMAGSFGAGATRSLIAAAGSAALAGSAKLTAIAGQFRQHAVNGMAKVLSPTGRRALALAAIHRVVSTSYAPDQEPTTDYKKKAAQLRMVMENPEATRARVTRTLDPVRGVDPVAHSSAVEAAMTRIANLARALPQDYSVSFGYKNQGPTLGEIDGWQSYEAVTSDKNLVFDYVRSGHVPERVREAMQEQHPEFLDEIREYVMTHPDEVKAAPYNTQKALSQLLGAPIVPTADAGYVLRMQQSYQDQKQKAQQAQMQMQGAAAMKAGVPTLGQILSIPRMN